MQTFGINGFGRIGRTSLRVWWEKHRDKLDLRMVNTSGSMELEEWAHLLKYDSNYGIFSATITTNRQQSRKDVTDENPILGTITVAENGAEQTITVTAQRDPNKLPWSTHGVNVVIESTGVFRTEEKAAQHFTGGAEYVIISAPSKGGNISSSVLGVNQFDKDAKVLSNASCTTNSVAPVVEIMNQTFGVDKAMLTTIHSYTDDQNVQDNSHRDMRRARSAAENIIPTTTGAAKTTTEIIPELKDKFDGMAVRVPTPVGSLSDMVFLTRKHTSVEEVNQTFIDASQQDRWQGILAISQDPIVSSDIIGRPESAIVDLEFTMVVQGNFVKVLSWYDNEWGYCNRLIDQVEKL